MKIFDLNKRVDGSIKDDLLSGLTVALALVPEAVAFAFVAGVSPIIGLYGAFLMGFITSIFGGRPGMISGATGAMAVVMVNLVSEGSEIGGGDFAGLQYLFVTLEARLMLLFFPVPIKAKYFVPLVILGDFYFGISNV